MINKKPKFKDRKNGVACWVNTDKNGREYLTIRIGSILKVNLFQDIPKPEFVEIQA